VRRADNQEDAEFPGDTVDGEVERLLAGTL
jgi:hypothetical protein